MKNILTLSKFSLGYLALGLLLQQSVLAAEVTVKNCDGTLLSSTDVTQGTKTNVTLVTDVNQASTATLQQKSSERLIKAANSDAAWANFSNVTEGEWIACTSGGKKVLSAEISKPSSVGTLAMLGAGVAGIGGIVALSVEGGSSGGSDTPITTSATESSSPQVATEQTAPVRNSVVSKPVEVVSTSKDCPDFQTLAATSGCRNTEYTDPLSPYK